MECRWGGFPPHAAAGYLVETASCLLGRRTEAESMEAAVVAWMELMPVLVKASPSNSALLHALFKVGKTTDGIMWVSTFIAAGQEASRAAPACC